AHSHLLWAGSRADEYAARVRGQPYWGGGIMRTVRVTREAGFDELLQAAQRRLRGYLRHGVTALEVKSGFGLDVETEERLSPGGRASGRRDAAAHRDHLLRRPRRP